MMWHPALLTCMNPIADTMRSSHCLMWHVYTNQIRCCTWLLTGIVGYLTMLRPTGARSPYIIMTVNCVWVAVAAFIALKAEFR